MPDRQYADDMIYKASLVIGLGLHDTIKLDKLEAACSPAEAYTLGCSEQEIRALA